MRVECFLIAYYDGETNKCFDEDIYSFNHFKEAYDYYDSYNKDLKHKDDYVKLYAYINEEIGLVLIGDYK